MLALHDLALADEQRRKPLGFEDIHERIHQQAPFEAAHHGSGATHRHLTWARDVNDGIVRPVRDRAPPTPRGREPCRPGVGQTPDPQLRVLGLSADQRSLEGHRRAQTSELVGMQRTSRIEAQSQDALVRNAIGRQLVQGREQKSNRMGLPSSNIKEAWKATESASHRRSWSTRKALAEGQWASTYRARSGG